MRRSLTVLICSAAIARIASAGPGSSQDQASAEALFQEGRRLLDAGPPVGRAVDGEAFSFEATGQERQDPGLVLDDKDAHLPPRRGRLTQRR